MNELRAQLASALKPALAARDTVAVAAIRSALAAIDNAGAVPGPDRYRPRVGAGAGEAERRELSIEETRAIVHAEITDRTHAADEFERLGRADEAARLRSEASVLQRFLRT